MRSRRRRPATPAVHWQGLTLRLATSADRAALARLADLEQTTRPAEPVLVGELMQRPVAALSLRDGSVIADPFTPTAELIELMRLRARQRPSASVSASPERATARGLPPRAAGRRGVRGGARPAVALGGCGQAAPVGRFAWGRRRRSPPPSARTSS